MLRSVQVSKIGFRLEFELFSTEKQEKDTFLYIHGGITTKKEILFGKCIRNRA